MNTVETLERVRYRILGLEAACRDGNLDPQEILEIIDEEIKLALKKE
jgi:hypothetical protein